MLFEDRSRAESFGVVADLLRPGGDRAIPPALVDALACGRRESACSTSACGDGDRGRAASAPGAAWCLVSRWTPRMAEVARTKGIEVEVAAVRALGGGGGVFRSGYSRRRPGIGSSHAREAAQGAASCLAMVGRLSVVLEFWACRRREVRGSARADLCNVLEPEARGSTPVALAAVPGSRVAGGGRSDGIADSGPIPGLRRVAAFAWEPEPTRPRPGFEHLNTPTVDHQLCWRHPRRRAAAVAVGDAIEQLGGSF